MCEGEHVCMSVWYLSIDVGTCGWWFGLSCWRSPWPPLCSASPGDSCHWELENEPLWRIYSRGACWEWTQPSVPGLTATATQGLLPHRCDLAPPSPQPSLSTLLPPPGLAADFCAGPGHTPPHTSQVRVGNCHIYTGGGLSPLPTPGLR